MDRENVVHLYNGDYSAEKSNGILKFTAKWMELEETILSEVTQSQKDKYGECRRFNLNFFESPKINMYIAIQTARTSRTILKRYGESGQPCLVPDLEELD
ncbi:protein of unknown function DUF1725 containing protein [Cricetulus griseus]|uniref:Uncharacterized protein n=1 Tax=Cricetulus griseus TaxID=10029 RepID=A0A061I262_CRIGR|nr:protein of unknown function DUF1725 containing protein [Cricetulus griseus]